MSTVTSVHAHIIGSGWIHDWLAADAYSESIGLMETMAILNRTLATSSVERIIRRMHGKKSTNRVFIMQVGTGRA